MGDTMRVHEAVMPGAWLASKQNVDNRIARLNEEIRNSKQRWWVLYNNFSIQIFWDKKTNLLWANPYFTSCIEKACTYPDLKNFLSQLVTFMANTHISLTFNTDVAEYRCKEISKTCFGGWRIPRCTELMVAVKSSIPLKSGSNYRILDRFSWLVEGGRHDFDLDSDLILPGDGHLLPVTDVLSGVGDENPLRFFLKNGCFPVPCDGNIDQECFEQLVSLLNAPVDCDSCAVADFIRNVDYLRCRLPVLEEAALTDPNKGVWELWPHQENQSATKIAVDGLVAANPESSIRDEFICIDFGTSSTVVAMKVNGKPDLLRVGVKDFFESPKPEHYENPTLLEFINLKNVLEDFTATPYQPLVNWNDVHCSHEALYDWRNAETDTDKVASVLPRLKQWALNSRDTVVPICGYSDKTEMELSRHQERVPVKNTPLTVSPNDPFDPVELYAWFLGLNINWRRRGIFLNYFLTFPVRYSSEVKNNILASFARGLQRSLPVQIVESGHFSRFLVQEMGSEPAAYAAAALPALGLEPTADGVAYAVFDFGGGTTDFDFGFYRLPTDAELDEEPCLENVLEHFGASGDNHLGGETLLEGMAFRVFCDNKELLAEKHITQLSQLIKKCKLL